MRLPFFIARRYLFSIQDTFVINIISVISMVGVGVGAMALIIVLSAFNGLEDLVESLYSSFDPDLKVMVLEGKTFDRLAFPEQEIKALRGVIHYTSVIEETALLKYKDKQSIAVLKGVEHDFLLMSGLDSLMSEGVPVLEHDSQNYAILGYGIGYNLSVFIEHAFDPINVYCARRGVNVSVNPAAAFKKMNIMPAGIFAINPDFDDRYMLVPLEFARELLDYDTEISAVEIGLSPGGRAEEIQAQVQALVGDRFIVKTRYQLNELIYKTNKTEKWITFLILSFILVIATFNLIGSLTMLIIDKQQDIFVLKSMGASRGMVRSIFLIEGMLITLLGACFGLGLGTALVKAQEIFGLVRLEGVIVEYYPVKIEAFDFFAILGMVTAIGLLASIVPVFVVTKRHFAGTGPISAKAH